MDAPSQDAAPSAGGPPPPPPQSLRRHNLRFLIQTLKSSLPAAISATRAARARTAATCLSGRRELAAAPSPLGRSRRRTSGSELINCRKIGAASCMPIGAALIGGRPTGARVAQRRLFVQLNWRRAGRASQVALANRASDQNLKTTTRAQVEPVTSSSGAQLIERNVRSLPASVGRRRTSC